MKLETVILPCSWGECQHVTPQGSWQFFCASELLQYAGLCLHSEHTKTVTHWPFITCTIQCSPWQNFILNLTDIIMLWFRDHTLHIESVQSIGTGCPQLLKIIQWLECIHIQTGNTFSEQWLCVLCYDCHMYCMMTVISICKFMVCQV